MAADAYLHAPCTNALNADAAAPLRGTRKSPVLSLTSYQTTPESFGMVLPSWPSAPIQAPSSPPRAVEPVSEIQKGFLASFWMVP